MKAFPTTLLLKKVVEGISEAVILEQKKKFKEEVSLANLAPTKPNWDLKRDVEKKLQKLERRTQVKIHEIGIESKLKIKRGKDSTAMLLQGKNSLRPLTIKLNWIKMMTKMKIENSRYGLQQVLLPILKVTFKSLILRCTFNFLRNFYKSKFYLLLVVFPL
ncbi:hypothetical protein DSO57_1033440 [Entomophthora muscae]|uniref:Uncharacterized protein n=1 Tax=Entomophthora muscae TaxID=34485 RepID=A0ACC2RES5_9FUNG|nr:hypothetical protein DSO57_1033440 [Entomophthora muscae]